MGSHWKWMQYLKAWYSFFPFSLRPKISYTHTTNYFNTFIEIAEDCPIAAAEGRGQVGGRSQLCQVFHRLSHDRGCFHFKVSKSSGKC